MAIFKKKEEETIIVADNEIVAPVNGKVIDLDKVNDVVFSKQQLGKTLAFEMVENKVLVRSPMNGYISVLFDDGHAFAIKGKNGVEVLVHLGINTFNAKGFRVLDKHLNQEVMATEPIVEVNMKQLKDKYDMTSVIVITDTHRKEIEFSDDKELVYGKSILSK